ncbi:MAG: 50S ribosomal protein L25/general stress protein Ctc [Alphaproteobacteria bacterium]|nr:50S ribosomal protein L25/general stress protein Ctc [Alphaproteobacteria bacterium]
MSKTIVLETQSRGAQGRGAARAVRRQGRVPAIIYGDGRDNVSVTLETDAVARAYRRGGFTSRVIELKVGEASERVLCREVQLHPVNDRPVHLDFMRLGKDTVVRLFVPVHFVGHDKSPGLKRGGVLNVVRHEIEFHVRADAIPEEIKVDLDGLDINDSVHIDSVKLPPGVKAVIRRNFTIASVVAPAAAEEKAVVAAEGVPAEGAAEGAAPAEGAAAAPAAAGKAPAAGAAPAAAGKAPAAGAAPAAKAAPEKKK